MSRSNSTTAFQGFSVFQPSLGAPLQWLPDLGTAELDEMIHVFLPGQASIQDKRAHISMDFFEYARQTGETFKFYPVPAASFHSVTTESPASSTTMYDSGYNSSFNVSPADSQMSPWVQSPATFASSASPDQSRVKSQSSSSKKSSSRSQTADFSSHPGMRIMTKDGRDVTNSASRGCKTKEQRDHAHLMRIIKACDACRRKKIRCDPSHRKRTASQAECKPQTKQKRVTVDPPPLSAAVLIPEMILTTNEFFETPESDPAQTPFEGSSDIDDLWNQFVQFEQEPIVYSTGYQLPVDYDFFYDPQGHFSPSLGTSTGTNTSSSLPSPGSPSQVFTPSNSVPAGLSPSCVIYDTKADEYAVLAPTASSPVLPYLNPGETHGTNYVDFNLFSPSSDFLDEEPQLVQKRSQRQPDSSTDLSNAADVTHGAAIQQSRLRSSHAESYSRLGDSPGVLQSFSQAQSLHGPPFGHGEPVTQMQCIPDATSSLIHSRTISGLENRAATTHPPALASLETDEAIAVGRRGHASSSMILTEPSTILAESSLGRRGRPSSSMILTEPSMILTEPSMILPGSSTVLTAVSSSHTGDGLTTHSAATTSAITSATNVERVLRSLRTPPPPPPPPTQHTVVDSLHVVSSPTQAVVLSQCTATSSLGESIQDGYISSGSVIAPQMQPQRPLVQLDQSQHFRISQQQSVDATYDLVDQPPGSAIVLGATLLVATLPVRYLVSGLQQMTKSRLSVQVQLAVFGLVSALLLSLLPVQPSGNIFDIVKILPLLSLTFMSLSALTASSAPGASWLHSRPAVDSIAANHHGFVQDWTDRQSALSQRLEKIQRRLGSRPRSLRL